MKTYRVQLTRVEHLVVWVDVQADTAEDANDNAWQMLQDGDIDFADGECAHADEFVNDIEED